MVSITRFCRNWTAERSGLRVRGRLSLHASAVLMVLALWMGLFNGTSVHAQAAPAVAHMSVERDSDGIYMNASLAFTLSPMVEDALEKGIALTFIAEAELVRERWYWLDRKVSLVQRYWRVSYQPLTRRWRLSVSSAPFDTSGLGVSVGQTYDQLSDVLTALQRIARWKVADTAQLRPNEEYQLQFRFQLDISQLPRPLQIGALGGSDWSLAFARSERVPAMTSP